MDLGFLTDKILFGSLRHISCLPRPDKFRSYGPHHALYSRVTKSMDCVEFAMANIKRNRWPCRAVGYIGKDIYIV